jgi:hypothetical protein
MRCDGEIWIMVDSFLFVQIIGKRPDCVYDIFVKFLVLVCGSELLAKNAARFKDNKIFIVQRGFLLKNPPQLLTSADFHAT